MCVKEVDRVGNVQCHLDPHRPCQRYSGRCKSSLDSMKNRSEAAGGAPLDSSARNRSSGPSDMNSITIARGSTTMPCRVIIFGCWRPLINKPSQSVPRKRGTWRDPKYLMAATSRLNSAKTVEPPSSASFPSSCCAFSCLTATTDFEESSFLVQTAAEKKRNQSKSNQRETTEKRWVQVKPRPVLMCLTVQNTHTVIFD
jgi:hypothetical protein